MLVGFSSSLPGTTKLYGSRLRTKHRNCHICAPTSCCIMRMSLIRAFLFDCDGVLAETEKDGHRVAFNRAFEALDLKTHWDVETYGRLLQIGGGKERMVAYWNQVGWPEKLGMPQSSTWLLAKVAPVHEKKTEIFTQMVRNGEISLRPGILEWITRALENGTAVAVCSTSNEKAVRELVVCLFPKQVAEQIPIFAGDQVEKKKPAPDIYELAVKTLGMDKKSCLVVEDSNGKLTCMLGIHGFGPLFLVGLRAAKAAGLPCVITKSYYTRGEDFSLADAVYESAEEWSWDKLESILMSYHK